MKNLKIAVVALIIGTTSMFASNIVNSENSINDLKNHVIRFDASSNIETEMEKNIKLKLAVNSEDEIVVLGLDSKNSDVLNYVRENVNGQKVNNEAACSAIEKQKSIVVTFSVNTDNEIVVLSVSTKNRDILNYVRKNINGQKL